jgi:DNA-binding HxlR family transcriptional regulator
MTDEPLRRRSRGDERRVLVAASAVLGRKWHPLIVHLLCEDGPLAFGELDGRIDDVSGKVLSESLRDLEEKDLVERTVADGKPVRVEYSLTTHGRGLERAVDELREWGLDYLQATGDAEDPLT